MKPVFQLKIFAALALTCLVFINGHAPNYVLAGSPSPRELSPHLSGMNTQNHNTASEDNHRHRTNSTARRRREKRTALKHENIVSHMQSSPHRIVQRLRRRSVRTQV
uniref:Secreted protein n=1 Tax=Rhipicephalus appendiculatus TaxID=34631 RepID=A0A131YBB9_RHIAP